MLAFYFQRFPIIVTIIYMTQEYRIQREVSVLNGSYCTSKRTDVFLFTSNKACINTQKKMLSQIIISSELILKIHIKGFYPRLKKNNTHPFPVCIHPDRSVMNKKTKPSTKHVPITHSTYIDEFLCSYHSHSEAKDFPIWILYF